MYWKYLYHLIYSLHNPIHVERFQKYFGLQLIQNDGLNPANDDSDSKDLTILKKTCSYTSATATKKYRIRNYFWYYLFSFGARLGYEIFYAFSFSYIYWNLDSLVCRKLMLVWALLMYIGQALKDLIRIPRPSGPNILILEPEYSLEYGMPSTHAMLALMVPVTLFSILINRYELSLFLFIICSIGWCTLICFSRLYLGMHSVLDIVVGLLLTCVLLIPIIPSLDLLDYFLVQHWIAPLVLIPLIIGLSLIYPKSNNFSPSRGDTIIIISAFGGVYLGTWLNYQLGIIHIHSDQNFNDNHLYSIVWPSFDQIPLIICRTILGLCSLFLLRLIGKQLSYLLVKRWTKFKDLKTKKTKHLTKVEVPTKMIPFIFAGLAISFVGPLLARVFNIERKSMALEA